MLSLSNYLTKEWTKQIRTWVQQPRGNILTTNILIEILFHPQKPASKPLVNMVFSRQTMVEAPFRSLSPIKYKKENSSEGIPFLLRWNTCDMVEIQWQWPSEATTYWSLRSVNCFSRLDISSKHSILLLSQSSSSISVNKKASIKDKINFMFQIYLNVNSNGKKEQKKTCNMKLDVQSLY